MLSTIGKRGSISCASSRNYGAVTIHEPAADWLLHGFVARGNLTLLTSLWKAGKTTLLSLLLSRRKHDGLLAGRAGLDSPAAMRRSPCRCAAR